MRIFMRTIAPAKTKTVFPLVPDIQSFAQTSPLNYSFLIAGHTKFGPDQSFGLIKKVYKVTHVSSLYEFARLVETSSNSGLNKVQLVETHDGRIIVTVRDWASSFPVFLGKPGNVLL